MTYDAVIIGAGLSGLAAGIRLSHFGKSVCILESHTVAGGLNSYYQRSGRMLDVGLHAMTNIVAEGTRAAALTRLLRQLRIRYDELGLVPQSTSRIAFPQASVGFSNDPAFLREEIARVFPAQVDGFDKMRTDLARFDEAAVGSEIEAISARQYIDKFLTEPLLREMLLCPLMYYGNAGEDDMALFSFIIMWKSIYETGFGRPVQGMKHVIELLLKKYEENGGELKMGERVSALRTGSGTSGEIGEIGEIVLESGQTIQAKQIFSSAGMVETLRLCGHDVGEADERVGRLSFVESIAFLEKPLSAQGVNESIIFFSQTMPFVYRRAEELADLRSGVICIPDNFRTGENEALEPCLRVTARASAQKWDQSFASGQYKEDKKTVSGQLQQVAETITGASCGMVLYEDLFTPRTIRRYTGKLAGAIYGSPVKQPDGTTPWNNLFVIGTDQGYLGIVGSMLSGISMANRYGLS